MGRQQSLVYTTVRNIPEPVKQALVDEAEASEASVAETAITILSRELKVKSPTTGKVRGPKAGLADSLQLRVSEALVQALWKRSRQLRTTQSRVAISIWADFFAIGYDPKTGDTVEVAA